MGYKFATRTRKNIKVLVEIMAEAEQLMSTNVSRHFKKKSCFMINLQHGIYFTRVENQRPIFLLPFLSLFCSFYYYYFLLPFARTRTSSSGPLIREAPLPTTVLLKPASSWNSHSGDAR